MKFATFARIAPVLALFSCVPPKAVVVAPAPVKKQDAVAEATIPEPPVPTSQDDGIRLPEFLDLPGDVEFRATVPTMPRTGNEANAVISRPPTDPPPRPKPKQGE